MDYTEINQIKISKLCFGGWQASGWLNSDEKTFCRLLDFAYDNGINFFDTAEEYGKGFSESLIGRTLSKKRENIVLASKFLPKNSKPEKIRKSLEASLKRLKTDYIDIYYQHWPAKDIPLDQTISELVSLKEAGKIRAIGVSNWMEPEWEEVSDPLVIDCLQPAYNLLWRGVEKNVLEICKSNDIAVIPYSPLAQGILTGKVAVQDLVNLKSEPRNYNVLLNKENYPEVLRVLDYLKEISLKYNKSMGQIALRWLLQQNVSSMIVGTTSEIQLKENLEVFSFKLDDDDSKNLSEISWNLSKDRKPHDTLWGWHPKKTTH